MRLLALLFVLFVVLLPIPALTATIHVPGDQPTIQAGINAAAFAGDSVLVAPGTYAGVGNKNLNLQGKAIFLGSEQGSSATIIDCESQGRGFYFQVGESSSTIIEGFTIRNGVVGGAFPDNWGGGILCVGSSPSIRNCVVTSCVAMGTSGRGGGVALFDSSPILLGCAINLNEANGGQGGGVHSYSSQPALTTCTIANNFASSGGGGVSIQLGSAASIVDCLLAQNSTNNQGGGMLCDATSSVALPGTVFESNNASLGAGLYLNDADDFTIEGVTFIAHQGGPALSCSNFTHVTFRQCAFQGNGTAIHCESASTPIFEECLVNENSLGVSVVNAAPSFVRCAFVTNTGGAFETRGTQAALSVMSCTLYQNAFGVNVIQGAASIDRTIIVFSKSQAVICSGGVAISCSDLYANLGGDWIDCIADQQGVNGNFSDYPEFCDAPSDDFTLNSLSPCAPGNSPTGCDLVGAFPVACGVTDVADSPPIADVRLTVIPNPVRGVARFEAGPMAPFTTLRIFDSQGRLVEQLMGREGNWEWAPGTAIPAGVYFAKGGAEQAVPVKFLYLR